MIIFIFAIALTGHVIDGTREHAKRYVYEEKKRIHDMLFHPSRVIQSDFSLVYMQSVKYDVDTTPIANHTHSHPLDIDVWVEIHTINEGMTHK